MTRAILLWLVLALPVFGYQVTEGAGVETDNLKKQVLEVEEQFAEMAAARGVKAAFLHFAADDAVIMRSNRIWRGKEGIRNYFDSVTLKNINLVWKPDFADVSACGDLAYTYGSYTFSAVDVNGKEIRSEGIFHTVWKKQSDGRWKFVWD